MLNGWRIRMSWEHRRTRMLCWWRIFRRGPPVAFCSLRLALLTVVIFLMIVWLSTASIRSADSAAEEQSLTPREERFASAAGFDEAHDIVVAYCSMCHAREVFWDGLAVAPKGVVLETPSDVARNARAIYLQAGVSHAMPPGNISFISDEERLELVRWYLNATNG